MTGKHSKHNIHEMKLNCPRGAQLPCMLSSSLALSVKGQMSRSWHLLDLCSSVRYITVCKTASESDQQFSSYRQFSHAKKFANSSQGWRSKSNRV